MSKISLTSKRAVTSALASMTILSQAAQAAIPSKTVNHYSPSSHQENQQTVNYKKFAQYPGEKATLVDSKSKKVKSVVCGVSCGCDKQCFLASVMGDKS